MKNERENTRHRKRSKQPEIAARVTKHDIEKLYFGSFFLYPSVISKRGRLNKP